MSDRH